MNWIYDILLPISIYIYMGVAHGFYRWVKKLYMLINWIHVLGKYGIIYIYIYVYICVCISFHRYIRIYIYIYVCIYIYIVMSIYICI